MDWLKINSVEINKIQETMVYFHVKNGSFIGIGRPIGRSIYFPAIRRGKRPLGTPQFDIIDSAGYEQFAANNSVKIYEDFKCS